MRAALRTFVALALFIALAGCSSQPKLAKVKGTVTLDGKPISAGTITFEMKGARPATATVVNGEITGVTTYAPGDGVPVGEHRVAVAANEAPASAVVPNPGDAKAPKGDYMSGKSLIPAAYNDPATSGLAVEIKPGENTIELKLLSTGPPK